MSDTNSSFYVEGAIYTEVDPVAAANSATLAQNAATEAAASATSAANAASSAVAAASGTALPIIEGTATTGVSNKWAREDHIHPLSGDMLKSSNLSGLPNLITARANLDMEAFGPAGSTLASGSDLNALTKNGNYIVTGAINRPAEVDPLSGCTVVHVTLGPGQYALQRINDHATDLSYERWQNAGTWDAWQRVMKASLYDPTDQRKDVFNYLPARVQAVSRPLVSKLDEVISVKDYNVPDDGVTDASPAIQKAIDDLAATGTGFQGGTIFFPKPATAYLLNAPLVVPPFISLRGDAGFSALLADDCDAIQLVGVCGLGCTNIEKLTIRTQNATASRHGIMMPGDASSLIANLYDITIRDNVFEGCDVPISLLTGQYITIDNNRGQNVGSFLQINGRVYAAYIARNKFTKASGTTYGSGIGVSIASFTYSDLGATRPEGIQLDRNQISGFDIAVNAPNGYIVNLNNNDIDAAVTGIAFKDVDGLNIRDNVIIVRGSAATYGIVGHGRTGTSFGAVNIDSNYVSGVSLTGTTTYGIVINDTGSGQDNVTISNNTIIDVSANDLLIQNPGNVKVLNNKMLQTGAITSPVATGTYIGARVSGNIVVENNDSLRTMAYDAGDIRAGYVRRRNNVVAGAPEYDTLTYVIANGASDVIAPGSDYYRISARETVVTGGPASVVVSVGQIVSESLFGSWATHTTTPTAGSFSIAYDGTDWRIYNNQGATCTFVVRIEREF